MATEDHKPRRITNPSRQALETLVHAWMDDILERPVDELFEITELAAALTTAIRGIAADPRNDEFLRQQVALSIDELRALEVEGRLPQRSITAIRDLAAQPLVIDEALMAELLDHPAARVLLRELLQQALHDFAEKIASLFPGGQTAFRFVDQARAFAAAAVGGVGISVEESVNESVDEALAPAFQLAARRMAEAEIAGELADWRGHVLKVLLDRPMNELIGTVDQVSADALAAQLSSYLHGIAEWHRLEVTVEQSIAAALERAGDQSLRAMIAGTSAETDWRPVLEKQIVDAAWPFVQSEAFQEWLGGLD